MVNHDNIPCEFEYTLITTYIKGDTCSWNPFGTNPSIEEQDFNLGERKNYAMLTPHRYLMKTIWKKPA
jgi:hypothetical protein